MNQTLIGEDFRLDVPFLTSPIGPDLTAPFTELFHAIDARRAPGASLVLLFAGVGASATTAIASGFARTAERALGLFVLYVAAGGAADHPAGGADDYPADGAEGHFGSAADRQPARRAETHPAAGARQDRARGRTDGTPDLLAAFRAGLSPGEIALPTRDRGIAWAGLGRVPALAGAETARLIDAARESFAVVVIDAGGMSARSLAPALARHCDGALLVARAGRTQAASLASARVTLERAGGEVLGAVLDGDEVRMPRFLASRL